jgi:Zn-dependent alcohol dehydrogenase
MGTRHHRRRARSVALVASRCTLEEINRGYQDKRVGEDIRGMIVRTDDDR